MKKRLFEAFSFNNNDIFSNDENTYYQGSDNIKQYNDAYKYALNNILQNFINIVTSSMMQGNLKYKSGGLYTGDPENFPVIKFLDNEILYIPVNTGYSKTSLYGRNYGNTINNDYVHFSQFPYQHFYRYTLLFTDEGLNISLFLKNKKLVINNDWITIFENINVNELSFREENSSKKVNMVLDQCYFAKDLKKISHETALNFPNKILAKRNPKDIWENTKEEKKIKVNTELFENREDFIKVILPFIEMGYTIVDEQYIEYKDPSEFNKSFYQKDHYEEIQAEIKRKKQEELEAKIKAEELKKQQEEDIALEKLDNIIGQENTNTIIEAINKLDKNSYTWGLGLSEFCARAKKNNKNKDGKFTEDYTIIQLLKDNNLYQDLVNAVNAYNQTHINDNPDVEITENNINLMFMYKLFLFTTQLNLKPTTKKHKEKSLNEILYGFINNMGLLTKVRFTFLPILFSCAQDVYNFYYLIGYTLSNIKGISDFSEDAVIKYNNNIEPNLNNFNFNIITSTLINISKTI